MTPREAAQTAWRFCWARTVNLCLPEAIRTALPDYEELPVYTMSQAPDELPAVCYIEAAIRSAVEEATKPLREALQAAEWGDVDYYDSTVTPHCPVCYGAQPNHEPECLIASVLSEPT